MADLSGTDRLREATRLARGDLTGKEVADAIDRTRLEAHKRWLDIDGCTCPHAIRPLGVLYGVSMGKGWVRLSTVGTCPVHGNTRG